MLHDVGNVAVVVNYPLLNQCVMRGEEFHGKKIASGVEK
jgi:hypothetical protein